MVEKIKAVGIAILLIIIGILGFLWRQKNERLKAVEYKLEMVKLDSKRDITLKELEKLKTEISSIDTSKQEEELAEKLRLISSRKEVYETSYEEAMRIINKYSNTGNSNTNNNPS